MSPSSHMGLSPCFTTVVMWCPRLYTDVGHLVLRGMRYVHHRRDAFCHRRLPILPRRKVEMHVTLVGAIEYVPTNNDASGLKPSSTTPENVETLENVTR